MAAHSSILAWEIPWTEEPGGLQSWGHKESDTTERLNQQRQACVCTLTLVTQQAPLGGFPLPSAPQRGLQPLPLSCAYLGWPCR